MEHLTDIGYNHIVKWGFKQWNNDIWHRMTADSAQQQWLFCSLCGLNIASCVTANKEFLKWSRAKEKKWLGSHLL